MATNYPVGIDTTGTTLPNPAATDFVDTAGNLAHHHQHDNENDAIRALENLLGTNASQTTPGGANRVINSSSSTAATWTATPTVNTLVLNGTQADLGVNTTSPVAQTHIVGGAAQNGTGTVTTTSGSPTVTGSGTSFTTQLHVGDALFSGGSAIGEIFSIANDTSLTLFASTGTVVTGATFTYSQPSVRSDVSGGTIGQTLIQTQSYLNANINDLGANINIVRYNQNPNFRLLRTGATAVGSAPTALTSGVPIGQVVFGGDDGSSILNVGAQITSTTGSAWTTANHQAFMSFWTTPAASTTVTEQMRLQSSGGLSIGNAVVGTDPGANNVIIGGALKAGATTITSTSANAFDVGPNGATNPTLRVDASAVSADAGLSIASGVGTSATQSFLSAIGVAPNVGLTLSGKNNGAITLSSPTNITSTSANALAVGPNGATNPTFQVDGSAVSAATGLRIRAAAPGGNVFVDTISQNANEALVFTSKGAAGIIFQTNTNGRNVFGMADVASAVNYLQVAGGAAGNGPVLSSQGGDTNIGLQLSSKGTGSVVINTESNGTTQMQVGDTAAAKNVVQVTGGVAGSGPVISAVNANGGTDTDVSLNLSPKGAGTVKLNGPASTAGADATFGVGLRSSVSSSSNIVGRFWSTAAAPSNDLFQVKSVASSGPGYNLLNLYSGANADGTAGTASFTIRGDGKVTAYNNVATAGLGVPAIYGYGRSTAQSGAVASVATYTPTADGSFEVSANVLVTTSTTHNFTVTCAYTDEGGTARTLTFNFSNVAGTIGTTIANAGGAVPYEGVPMHIRAKANTAITIATTGTFTSVTYNVEGNIKQIA